MSETPPRRRVTVTDALRQLPAHDDERFARIFQNEQLEVEIYAPRVQDLQTPHDRDEAYVVVSGAGTFVYGDERTPFGPGDFLFVPAGVEHRFVDFTDDLIVWVFFFGPPQDAPSPHAAALDGADGTRP